jgi:DNA-binding MarR family transcriptional regulator
MPDSPLDATPPLGPLLMACARQLDEIAQAQVNREVGMRLARPGLMRLVPYLDGNGIRPTELAKRADVSKQAVGQTLRACEELGVVRFDPDPEDRRAHLVRLTPLGLRAVRYGESVLAFLESELASRVGDATIRDLSRALLAVQHVLDEWGSGSAPSRTPDPSELPVRARRPR